MIRAALIACVLLGCGRSDAPAPVPTDQPPEPAGIAISADTRLVLVDAGRGRALLGARDEFVSALSEFDRQSRLGSRTPIDEARFLEHVRANVVDWDAERRGHVEAAAATLARALAAAELRLPLPATIEVVLTTGDEEIPGAAYTRGRAIVFSRGSVRADLHGLLAHELFHVLTRNAPALRDPLYAAIGFAPIAPLTLPPALAERRITNPDAPVVAHAIRVRHRERELLAAPVLIAPRDYDGGSFFDYVEPRLYAVDDKAGITLENGAPVAIEFADAGGFFEQVGRNTQYLIHPEEILAENFRILVFGASEVATPTLIERLTALLRD